MITEDQFMHIASGADGGCDTCFSNLVFDAFKDVESLRNAADWCRRNGHPDVERIINEQICRIEKED